MELGIDDPLAWFNSVDSAVIDRWMAYRWAESDKNETAQMMTPEEANKRLAKNYG